tara:strand:+ start:68 stop:397 length:330 start_codon:yes stop_codon:yes gene_type:complete
VELNVLVISGRRAGLARLAKLIFWSVPFFTEMIVQIIEFNKTAQMSRAQIPATALLLSRQNAIRVFVQGTHTSAMISAEVIRVIAELVLLEMAIHVGILLLHALKMNMF